MPEKWIKICHPDLPDNNPVTVAVASFKNLHSRNGWVEFIEEKADGGDAVESIPRTHSEPESNSKPATETESKKPKPKPKPTPRA